jgi:tetratricopeptide (TPR) repeat protein
MAYRNTSQDASDYEKAVEGFQNAIKLDPENARYHRELGVTYNKQNLGILAAESLKESLRLRANDPETLSILGGALRRLGMEGAPRVYNRKALEEARGTYGRARKIKEDDLYAELNFARINLLLSKWDPESAQFAKDAFKSQLDLSRHKVRKDPKDYWEIFNLGEIHLFSGEFTEAEETYKKGVAAIPIDVREDKIRSVLGPFRDYVKAEVLDGELLSHVEKLIKYLESVRNG